MKYCLKHEQHKQYYTGFEEAISVSVWFANLLYKLSNSAVMLMIFVSKLSTFSLYIANKQLSKLASLLTLPICHSLKILKAHFGGTSGVFGNTFFKRLFLFFTVFNRPKTSFSWRHLGVPLSKPLTAWCWSHQIANSLHNYSSPSFVIFIYEC